MPEPAKRYPSIDIWLNKVRQNFCEKAPDLLPLLDAYAAEATFGRGYIEDDLSRLRAGAAILEVGAGSFLLSCQLIREGFDVTALEPIGTGFSHFYRMQQLVIEVATDSNCLPKILAVSGEALCERDRFDYAFSVNVMEHVDEVERTVVNITNSLVVNASYRFICPNYLFPYEPHLNIPTLFSKRLTEKVFGRKIFTSSKALDPVGTWNSLNWINVVQVSRIVQKHRELQVAFNRHFLITTCERIISDPQFAARRSAWMRKLIGALIYLKLHRLLKFMPATLQPIMDCKIYKIFILEPNV